MCPTKPTLLEHHLSLIGFVDISSIDILKKTGYRIFKNILCSSEYLRFSGLQRCFRECSRTCYQNYFSQTWLNHQQTWTIWLGYFLNSSQYQYSEWIKLYPSIHPYVTYNMSTMPSITFVLTEFQVVLSMLDKTKGARPDNVMP